MLGTRITLDNKTKQYVHADCLWPSKTKPSQASPITKAAEQRGQASPGGSTQKPVPNTPSTLELLRESIGEIKSLGLGEPNNDSPTLAAVFAGKVSLYTTLLIHKDKVREHNWKEGEPEAGKQELKKVG